MKAPMAVLCLLLLSGCATRSYVRQEVRKAVSAEVMERIDGDAGTLYAIDALVEDEVSRRLSQRQPVRYVYLSPMSETKREAYRLRREEMMQRLARRRATAAAMEEMCKGERK
jgi:hypothetical protein